MSFDTIFYDSSIKMLEYFTKNTVNLDESALLWIIIFAVSTGFCRRIDLKIKEDKAKKAIYELTNTRDN